MGEGGYLAAIETHMPADAAIPFTRCGSHGAGGGHQIPQFLKFDEGLVPFGVIGDGDVIETFFQAVEQRIYAR